MKNLFILALGTLFIGCSSSVADKPTYLQEKIYYPSKNILGFELILFDEKKPRDAIDLCAIDPIGKA